MSKQIKLRVTRHPYVRGTWPIGLLAFFLILGAAFAPPNWPASAQHTAPGNETTSATARDAAFTAATNEVLKETSEIRELPVLRAVQSSAQSRAEIERMIMDNLDRETKPGQIHATEVTLKKLGLAPPDVTKAYPSLATARFWRYEVPALTRLSSTG